MAAGGIGGRFLTRNAVRAAMPESDVPHTHLHPPAEAIFDGPLTLESLVALLRERGLRMTANRRHILQALLAATVPQSLEQIQSAAAAHSPEGDAPDFATVFRMMALLEELRVARRVHLGRPTSHYELTDGRHHRDHLVCTDCGRVTPLEGACPVEEMETLIAREHGYTGLTHSLEFFGRCGPCSGEK